MRWYVDFLDRILGAQRVVGSIEDKREIAESTLLRICAYWESFVDEELVDCANIDSSTLPEFTGVRLPTNLPRAVCEAILFRGGYLDFPSVGALKGFAKRALAETVNPFAKIRPATAAKIDEVFTIRNYLAHQSKASRRALMKMYRENYDLGRFQEPGRFLLANNAQMLAEYIGAFIDASQQMRQII